MRKLMAAGVMLAMVTGTQANIIGVNLYHSGSILMANSQYAGVIGSSRTNNWNNWGIDAGYAIVGTAIDSTGAALTGFSVTSSGSGLHPYNGDGANDGDRAMQSDYIDIRNGETVTMTVSGIPYAEYDVYVYAKDDGTARAGSVSIGGTTYYARGTGTGLVPNTGIGWVGSSDTTIGSGTDIDQGNYILIQGVTGSDLTMNWSTLYAGDTTQRFKPAGFQIVAIPEPATIGMIGMVGIGLLAVRRFRM